MGEKLGAWCLYGQHANVVLDRVLFCPVENCVCACHTSAVLRRSAEKAAWERRAVGRGVRLILKKRRRKQ